MRRTGISLTTKFLALLLALSLIPVVIVSFSTISTYQNLKTEVSQSLDEIQGITTDKSDEATLAAVSETRDRLRTLMEDNLRQTRDDKIDKYSRILSSVEVSSGMARGYIERNWDTFDTSSQHPRFRGTLWAGPENTDSKRQQYSEELNRMSRLGILFEEMDTSNEFVNLAYFATDSDNVVISKNITGVLRSAGVFSPKTRPWYQAGKDTGETVWTKPYVDIATQDLTTTIANPVYRDGDLFGVVGIDVYLNTMKQDLLETDPGLAFLLDSDGEVVVYPGMAAPNKTVYAERTFSGRNLLTNENVSGSVRELARNMVNHRTGVETVTIEGQESYVAYGPLEVNDWSVGIAVPVAEMLSPTSVIEEDISTRFDRMSERIGEESTQIKARVDNRIQRNIQIYIFLFLIMGITIIAAGYYYSRTITQPIIKLHKRAESISKGGIEDEVHVDTGDEIEDLADAFNRVMRTIKILQKRDAPKYERDAEQ